MSEIKRKIFTSAEKAKVALAAVKGIKTINEIAQEHGVHPTQVSQWKKELLDNVGSTRFCVLGGDHRLVQPQGAGLAAVKYNGCRFCVDCLKEAIKHYGLPTIFNTDQGSPFTSDSFTGLLIQQGITISMDGRRRALDNSFVERLWRTVKYEDVYLNGYETLPTLLLGLTDYFLFYNGKRRHQSLDYTTLNVVYLTATGGGAKIVDRFIAKAK